MCRRVSLTRFRLPQHYVQFLMKTSSRKCNFYQINSSVHEESQSIFIYYSNSRTIVIAFKSFLISYIFILFPNKHMNRTNKHSSREQKKNRENEAKQKFGAHTSSGCLFQRVGLSLTQDKKMGPHAAYMQGCQKVCWNLDQCRCPYSPRAKIQDPNSQQGRANNSNKKELKQ